MATKSKTLKVGDAVTIKDRLWAVVDSSGRLVVDHVGTTPTPLIWTRRSDVRHEPADGERIIRLRDIIGDVVR